MDVNEIIGLAKWMKDYVSPAMNSYELLASAMQQNTNSGNKVPIRDELESVRTALLAMPVDQLSYQQTDLLTSMEIRNLLGKRGWKFVERTVKEGNYDPASSAIEIVKANDKIRQTLSQFVETEESLHRIGVFGTPEFDSGGKVTIRVRFLHNAKISDVSELKKWSTEWYEISRGLTMAAGERPEDIEVKGASTGSVILILGATLTVASIVALIMKQVASTVKSTAEIAHTLQDWKMRKVADIEVERVLTARRTKIEDSGAKEALEIVKEKMEDRVTGDVENALKKSIDKIFKFAAKGGEVDILPPPADSLPDNGDHLIAEAIMELIENVEHMRSLKAATQLLLDDETVVDATFGSDLDDLGS